LSGDLSGCPGIYNGTKIIKKSQIGKNDRKLLKLGRFSFWGQQNNFFKQT
jgi:hypothetical protein